MKILVTGGAGLVGSHLCRKLIKQGHEVIAIDNLLTGSKRNIADLIDANNFTFIYNDVINPIDIQGLDQIYHLACAASPVQFTKNPLHTTKTSVIGTINALDLAKKNNAKILLSSTSEVYGDPLVHPQNENYWGNVNPVGPRACYDEGKRCAESICFDYHRAYGLDIRIIRIFNTYGPSMDPKDGRAISNFIIQALRNEDITVKGDGSQTRSFQYIDDLLVAIDKMMNNKKDFLGPVNLGNPSEFEIGELANIVLELIPESKSKIIYVDLPQDDPKRRKPDISLAKEKLNWEPRIKLADGLKPTIEYFKNFIEEEAYLNSEEISKSGVKPNWQIF